MQFWIVLQAYFRASYERVSSSNLHREHRMTVNPLPSKSIKIDLCPSSNQRAQIQ
jgi:hypothetical protein